MIIGILVVVWIGVLTPIVVKHFRDNDADRSIVSFKRRLAQMGNDQPIVEPAYRLDDPRETGEVLESPAETLSRPRLRLVPAGATTSDLDRDMSWEEWSRSMADEPTELRPRPVEAPRPSRVTAYSHMPHTPVVAPTGSSAMGSRSQRVRRRRVLMGLASSVLVSTLLFFAFSNVIVDVWALCSWLALGGFLGLMYYAMTTGLMSTPTIRVAAPALPRVGARAPQHAAAFTGHHDDEYDDEEWARAL